MSDPSAPAILPSPQEMIGRKLGDFEIERLIGTGGMGEVFLARQLSLPRPVALKILRPHLAADAQYLKRFEVEAKAVAPISHAHIVSVYAIGHDQGFHFIAFEYVKGLNLRQYIDRHGPLPEDACLRIAAGVAAALTQAAEAGIVHRDIKPENVLITRRGDVKVADFGLARHVGEDVRLTQTGVTMGTPLYMSPEQIQGQSLDARSDLYSLGIMCYHMLSGEPPFRGETAMAVAIQHCHGTAESLSALRPDVRPELIAVIERLMAKRPEERYETPKQALRDLERMRAGESPLGVAGVKPASQRSQGTLSRFLAPVHAGVSWLIDPKRRHWTALAALPLVAVLSFAVVRFGEQFRQVRRSILAVNDIPVQETGFMQYSYARSMESSEMRERALWAVLIRYRGDDANTIRAAQDLAEMYLASDRLEDLDRVGRFLIDREDLHQTAFGYLLEGLRWSRQGEAARSETSFAQMLETAGRSEWLPGSLDWLARKYFLAHGVNARQLNMTEEQLKGDREKFWNAFLVADPAQRSAPAAINRK